MFKVTTKVTSGIDMTSVLRAALKELSVNEVLVGVPAEKTQRDDDAVPNSLIAYVQNYGSPTQNIPARPFMEPGIADAKDQIEYRMRQAAESAFDGKTDGITKGLTAAGLVASTSIKNKIQTGPFEPLKPATLAARRRRGRTGTVPLIDTSQMRAAITFIVRRKT